MGKFLGSILLADDEETFLEATSELFQEEGFDCHTVRNAEELSGLLQGALEFDLLITDLNMPGNRVMELISEVRSQSQQLPVIVVTGYPSLPSAVESVRLHVLEYFIKPVDFPTLLSAVKKGIQHKEVLRMVRQAQKEVANRSAWLAVVEDTLCSYSASLTDPRVKELVLSDPQTKELKLQIEGLSRLFGSVNFPKDDGKGPSSSDYFRLRESVYDTIQILQKTKSAFRSKDLAQLRKRLEDVLRETTESLKPPTPSTEKD